MLSLFLSAALGASAPQPDKSRPAWVGARAEARVAVRIVAGAKIAAGEKQSLDVPPLSDSQIRTPSGNVAAARLVEFQ
ncbi:hypothetical protein [Sphingomonas mesophila]|uniref:hypothetical protein n=1 Tax=Sphingomonas mesophila TaxID=2303576 RepID=UPI0013C335E7|nr:hypothetical protein [Sphingomonas mesophila]